MVKLGPLLFIFKTLGSAANLLFLEAPVGVGFSYSNTSSDLHVQGDNNTANDSYEFLVYWFKRFPQYKSNEFYIAGESYGGHYVPQLANVIFDQNKKATMENYINLKGIMIRNGLMNDETDFNGMIDYAWSHAIISDRVYQSIKTNCNFAEKNQTTECQKALAEYESVSAIIDIHSLYSPRCVDGSSKAKSRFSEAPKFLTKFELLSRIPAGFDPCLEEYATAYFNRPDVQEALNANGTKIPRPWSP